MRAGATHVFILRCDGCGDTQANADQGPTPRPPRDEAPDEYR
jgi:hypothetical protein